MDRLDLEFLKLKGKAQDILKETLDLDASQNNAVKYIAGIRHYLRHKRKLMDEDPTREIGEMEETTYKADGSLVTKRELLLSEEDSKNPQRIMELMGYDPLLWEVLTCKTRRNYWDVTIKNSASEGEKHTNHAYMCELTIKPIKSQVSSAAIREVFNELQAPKLVEVKYKPSDLLLELPLMDVHIGKQAWADETGSGHFDLDIAAELYRATVIDILSEIKQAGWKVGGVVFPVGQDFFHVDTPDHTTTRGTHVDTDSRWQKIYQVGIELLIWTVEELRQLAPVDIFYIGGNHDKMTAYFATLHLDAYFRNLKGVQVDLSPAKRKYYRWGKCLIGFSHGKMEGKRIEHAMQVECEHWSDTKYREWHLGDLHHEQAKEVGGVIIRRISAITETDAWHAEMGFVGSVRKAQAFLWDKERGKRFTIDSTVQSK